MRGHLGALAEVGAEAALATQPGQPASAGAGNHEPVAADDVAGHGAGVLKQERARPAADRAGDPFDAHETGRPIRPGGLEELHDAVAGDVAAEAFLDVDSRQHGALGRLRIGRGLVLVHRDDRVRTRPGACLAHVLVLPRPDRPVTNGTCVTMDRPGRPVNRGFGIDPCHRPIDRGPVPRRGGRTMSASAWMRALWCAVHQISPSGSGGMSVIGIRRMSSGVVGVRAAFLGRFAAGFGLACDKITRPSLKGRSGSIPE